MRSVCAEPAPAAAEAPATTAVALAPAAAVAAPADTKVEVAKGDRFRVYKAMLDEGECGVHCGTRACVRVAAAPGRAHEEGERREKLARVAAKKKKRCAASLTCPLLLLSFTGWPKTWCDIVLDKMIKADIDTTAEQFQRLVRGWRDEQRRRRRETRSVSIGPPPCPRFHPTTPPSLSSSLSSLLLFFLLPSPPPHHPTTPTDPSPPS